MCREGFLDTNVLASAVATRDLCADVLRKGLASHPLLTSAEVLHELSRVRRTKFGIHQVLIDEFLSLLQQDTVFARPGPLPSVDIHDRDDLPILSAAISAGADAFVTGDRELLDLDRIERMAILSPRNFWEKLKAQPRRKSGREKPRRSR